MTVALRSINRPKPGHLPGSQHVAAFVDGPRQQQSAIVHRRLRGMGHVILPAGDAGALHLHECSFLHIGRQQEIHSAHIREYTRLAPSLKEAHGQNSAPL